MERDWTLLYWTEQDFRDILDDEDEEGIYVFSVGQTFVIFCQPQSNVGQTQYVYLFCIVSTMYDKRIIICSLLALKMIKKKKANVTKISQNLLLVLFLTRKISLGEAMSIPETFNGVF